MPTAGLVMPPARPWLVVLHVPSSLARPVGATIDSLRFAAIVRDADVEDDPDPDVGYGA